MKHKLSRKSKGQFAQVPACIEALERRTQLSTTPVYAGVNGVEVHWSEDSDPNRTGQLAMEGGVGTSDSFMPEWDNLFTCDITNLPEHTMVRVGLDVNPEAWNLEGDEVTVSAGDRDFTLDHVSDTPEGYLADDGTGNNRWTQHSGDDLSITIDATSLQPWMFGVTTVLRVDLYNPTVSLTGGGSTVEDNGLPLGFAANRDLPAGYQGQISGDDAIPDTSVFLDWGGTADMVTDYIPSVPNVVQIKSPSPATLGQSMTHTVFSATPVADSDLEPAETVMPTIEADPDHYVLGNSVATGYIEDDDVEWAEGTPITAYIVGVVNGKLPETSINSTVQFSVQAADDDLFRHYGEAWQHYSDDVSSGNTSYDYHIKWTASAGTIANPYGSTVTWTAPDWAAGQDDRDVTITATVDDFNRGSDVFGYDDGPATTQSATQPVWQVTLDKRQNGTVSPLYDGAPVDKEFGGGKLGFVTPNSPKDTAGYFMGTEIVGTVGGNISSGLGFSQTKDGKTSAIVNSVLIGGTPAPVGTPDFDSTYGWADNSPMHNGVNVHQIFAVDTPGFITDATNDRHISDGWTKIDYNWNYHTAVNLGGVRVSNNLDWHVKFVLSAAGGKWALGG